MPSLRWTREDVRCPAGALRPDRVGPPTRRAPALRSTRSRGRSETEPSGCRVRPATAGVVSPHGGHRGPPARPRQLALADTGPVPLGRERDRKSTRLNSSHANISYAVFCLKKKKCKLTLNTRRPPLS